MCVCVCVCVCVCLYMYSTFFTSASLFMFVEMKCLYIRNQKSMGNLYVFSKEQNSADLNWYKC